jgi:hypothetical protein
MTGPTAGFAFLAQPIPHWLGPALYASRVLTGRTRITGKTER